MFITETIAAGIAAIAIACGGLAAYAIHRAGRAQNEAIDSRISALEEALAAARERLDRTGVRITNLQKRRSEDRSTADANLLAVRDGLAERIDALSARIEALEETTPSFSVVD